MVLVEKTALIRDILGRFVIVSLGEVIRRCNDEGAGFGFDLLLAAPLPRN